MAGHQIPDVPVAFAELKDVREQLDLQRKALYNLYTDYVRRNKKADPLREGVLRGLQMAVLTMDNAIEKLESGKPEVS